MMKKIGFLLLTLLSLYALYAFNVSYNTNYTVLRTVDSVEIRKYSKAYYASYYTRDNSDNSKFRVLANYIFGGNDRQEQIGMTSPVNMRMSSQKNEMLFLMPDRYEMESLPVPDNNDIELISIDERIVATIRFSGYANDTKVARKKKELIDTLEKHSIDYTDEFELLVYDSPYKVVNRRNEVLVVLK